MKSLVAVYGSLRKGLGNHRFLTSSKFLGKDVITGFNMYSLGAFPYVTPTKESNTIVVEVYEVNDNVFLSLDALEGYPTFYDRMKITTKYGYAWIYFIKDYGKHPKVVSGDWIKFYKGDV